MRPFTAWNLSERSVDLVFNERKAGKLESRNSGEIKRVLRVGCIQKYKESVQRFRVQRSGLGTGSKLKTRSPCKKFWFCHIIVKYYVPDLWWCGRGRFSRTKRLQNDVWWWECNLWTSEPLNQWTVTFNVYSLRAYTP